MQNYNHFEFSTYAYDDLKLYGQGWTPPNPKALILLMHDLGEDSQKYKLLGQFICKHQVALMVLDGRGNGKSDGNSNKEVFYSLLMHDIRKLIKIGREKFKDIPIFLIGVGYGGNLVLNYGIRVRNELTGIIAVSPWLRLAFNLPKIQRNLERSEKINLPALSGKGNLTLQHLQVITSAGLFALGYGYTIDRPVLLIHGTEDKITSPIASKSFSVSNPNFIQTWLYKDKGHAILQEDGWESIGEDLIDWVQLIISKRTVVSNLSVVAS